MKIWDNYKYLILFLIGYTLLRVVIINVNVTEWGDSFRILRAAESLLHFSYPLDEKRLPLFSALLAPGLLFLEPVLWGRIYAILASLVNLSLTAVLFKLIYPKAKQSHLVLVMTLLAFNPIFFYWSLRIMAETTFAMFVLLAFVVCRGRFMNRPYVMGLILSLSALTRYEGFLLAGAFGLSYLLKKDWRSLVKTFSVWVLLVAPWFILTKIILRGGTSDAYVAELTTFNFDLYRLGYFLTYSLFFVGSPILLALLLPRLSKLPSRRNLLDLISNPLLTFVLLEFALFFVWTPSLPRIMLPTIPLATIFVVKNLVEVNLKENRQILIFISLLSVICYLLFQFKFRLYFLVLSYTGLGLILFSSFWGIVALWAGSKKLFLIAVLGTFLISSFVVVANQRLVYSTVYEASKYASALSGKIAYSDETGVSAWYLGEKGIYYPQQASLSSIEQGQWLQENKVSSVLDTNEFNRGSRLDVSKMGCPKRFGVVISDTLTNLIFHRSLSEPSETLLYSDVCKL